MATENMNENAVNNPETEEVKKTEASSDAEKETGVSKEEQIQALMNEVARQKRAIDKLTSANADLTKKYRATLSEAEVASQEKAEREAEREEQFQSLLKENKVNKLEKNFILLGYTDEQAHKAAVAQYDGDTDTLFKVQSEVQEAVIKRHEAEWIKSRPAVQSGSPESEKEDKIAAAFRQNFTAMRDK